MPTAPQPAQHGAGAAGTSLLPVAVCVGSDLANIGDTSGSQLTPSAAVCSQGNRQLGKLLHLRDLFGWRWDGGKDTSSLGITVVLEEAESRWSGAAIPTWQVGSWHKCFAMHCFPVKKIFYSLQARTQVQIDGAVALWGCSVMVFQVPLGLKG